MFFYAAALNKQIADAQRSSNEDVTCSTQRPCVISFSSFQPVQMCRQERVWVLKLKRVWRRHADVWKTLHVFRCVWFCWTESSCSLTSRRLCNKPSLFPVLELTGTWWWSVSRVWRRFSSRSFRAEQVCVLTWFTCFFQPVEFNRTCNCHQTCRCYLGHCVLSALIKTPCSSHQTVKDQMFHIPLRTRSSIWTSCSVTFIFIVSI